MSAARRLPARPSLEQLRKQAKDRLHQLRQGDPRAMLADAQLALAGEYGFESWPRLVHHVEGLQESGRPDQEVSVDGSARVTRAGASVFPAHVRVSFWT